MLVITVAVLAIL